jgi:hypothetical protein
MNRIRRSTRRPKIIAALGKLPIDTGLTSTQWKGRRASNGVRATAGLNPKDPTGEQVQE